MQKVLLILAITSSCSLAQAAVYCSDIFSLTDARVRPQAINSGVKTRNLPEPITPMELNNPITPRGRIRLIELLGSQNSPHRASIYANTIYKLIQQQAPEIEVSKKDYIYALDILGEKRGLLRTFAFRNLNIATMDMLGVHPLLIQYRTNPEAGSYSGTQRVVLVIKEDAKDYSDQPTAKLLKQKDFVQWAAKFLQREFENLINLSDFQLHRDHPNFPAAYQAFSQIPRSKERLSEKDFLKAYDFAYSSFMKSLTPEELLHLTPTFFQDKAQADKFSLRAYYLVFQRTADQFEQTFPDVVKNLKLRLQQSIHQYHQKFSGRNYGFSQKDPESSDSFLQTDSRLGDSSLESNPFVAEANPQLRHGSDFWMGSSHQNLSISTLLNGHPTEKLDSTVGKLHSYGLRDLSELQRLDAGHLYDRLYLSLNEIVTLAEAMTEHGVYLRFPVRLYYQLTREQRMELQAPRNRNFMYDHENLRYYPAKFGEKPKKKPKGND